MENAEECAEVQTRTGTSRSFQNPHLKAFGCSVPSFPYIKGFQRL